MRLTSQVLKFSVASEDAGQRLDVFLDARLNAVSRSQIAKLIQEGHVLVNGQTAKPSFKLKAAGLIDVALPQTPEPQCGPENIPLDILYEDADVLVINKPAGLVVHPAPGHANGTLVNAVLNHCPGLKTLDEECRFGIVHRLDRDTSGVMVIAKTALAFNGLTRQFKDRQTQKNYLALVLGNITGSGTVDAPLGRAARNRKKMSAAAAHTRNALTQWQALKNYNGVTLLNVRILTGRTHQIRVHMAHLRHPVIGDRLYGVQNLPQVLQNYGLRNAALHEILKPVSRQMLHAFKLGFQHPKAKTWLSFTAPMPQDMRQLIAELEAGLTAINPANTPLDFTGI